MVTFSVQPFIVAASSLCSLKDAVLDRWLGRDLEPYVLCLRQLASSIAYLHSRRIILCDFAADTIFVQKLSEDNKDVKVRYLLPLPPFPFPQTKNKQTSRQTT